MSDYHIEKLRRPLSVVLTDGSRFEGDVFLRPTSRHRSRPEEPADLLNDDEPFFALVRNGEAVLISKDNVALAHGVNIHRGRVTNQAVAETFGLECVSAA